MGVVFFGPNEGFRKNDKFRTVIFEGIGYKIWN